LGATAELDLVFEPQVIFPCELADLGTTGNPYWCAEQLVGLPGKVTIVESEPIRVAAGKLGRRLLAASEQPVR